MNANGDEYYNTVYRIWAVMAFGAGTPLLNTVMSLYPDPRNMYIALTPADISDNIPAEAVKASRDIPLSAAEKIFELCDKKGIKHVTSDSADYPARLRGVFCPPPVLFYKGDISGINDRLSIGIVGARKPSVYSLKVTAGIVRALAKSGLDIVSGFAEGIDICAHMTAIKGGTRTFAVLGAGIDADYPKANARFRDSICENGAFISEYLPGTPAAAVNFPKRNRLLAGLSMSVAVIEAGERSGSLNSASHCSEQGKTVFALAPSDLFDPRYRGNVDLIRNGAITLMGARDIYNEYCSHLSHTIDENSSLSEKMELLKQEANSLAEAAALKSKEELSAKGRTRKKLKIPVRKTAVQSENILAEEEKSSPAELVIPDDISEAGRKILLLISETGHSLRADEISAAADISIDDVLNELTELEISGMLSAANGSYSIV